MSKPKAGETPEQAETRRRKAREYMKKYYRENPEYAARSKQRAKQWAANNRDRANAISREGHRRIKAALTPEQLRKFLDRRAASTRKWQEKNKERQAAYHKKRLTERLEMFNRIKTERGCQRCGNKDWRCLQFHHRNPEEKEFTLSQARGGMLERLEAEIAKCDVVCANCHAIHHWEMRG